MSLENVKRLYSPGNGNGKQTTLLVDLETSLHGPWVLKWVYTSVQNAKLRAEYPGTHKNTTIFQISICLRGFQLATIWTWPSPRLLWVTAKCQEEQRERARTSYEIDLFFASLGKIAAKGVHRTNSPGEFELLASPYHHNHDTCTAVSPRNYLNHCVTSRNGEILKNEH